jgi:hypothetical protein
MRTASPFVKLVATVAVALLGFVTTLLSSPAEAASHHTGTELNARR